MCENLNANSAAALREARRRKILENSANRLKLIENLNSSLGEIASESLTELKPQPDVRKPRTYSPDILSPELNSKLSEVLNSNKELQEISDFLLNDNAKVVENEVEEDDVEGEYTEVGIDRESYSFLNFILEKRLHYVLLALLVNILFFFNAGYLFYESIFCPFYSLKVIEFASRKEEKQFPPMLYLLIAGLPKSAQKVAKIILSLSLILLSDLCIYLFTFVIGTKIINNQY